MEKSGFRSARPTIFRWLAFFAVGLVLLASGLWFAHQWDVSRQLAEEFRPETLNESAGPMRAKIRAMTSRAEVDAWLATEEASVAARLAGRGITLKPGQSKIVKWASGDGFESELALVSIHGFSASRLETDPVISEIGEKLHANVVFTRLAAHGLSNGEEFATVRARDWALDVEEAIEIGLRVGRRVAIVGMSTGAPLVLEYIARHDGEIRAQKKIASIVLMSPNYDPAAFGTFLLTGSTGRFFATAILGPYRQFETENKLHAERWTWRYRTEGLAAMMTAVESVRRLDFSKVPIPVLTIYSHLDDVVSVSDIEKRSREFAPPSQTIEWANATRHQLASATFTPERRFELEELIQNWLQKF